MKAVLLARGLGSRMRDGDGATLTASQDAAAAAGSKGMMPIPSTSVGVRGTRPFLDHVLSALADAGCTLGGLTFFVWEGVALYLTRAAVTSTPRRCACAEWQWFTDRP